MTAPTPTPAPFPGRLVAWQDIPRPIQRVIVQRMLDRALELWEGPAGLLKWLYVGTRRPDGTTVSYALTGEQCWPYVLEDTRAALAAAVARTLPPEVPK